MKSPAPESFDSLRDGKSIWKSYRQATMRFCQRNVDQKREPQDGGSALPGDRQFVQRTVDGLSLEMLKMEVRRLRRLLREKNLIIDMLMEKVGSLQARRTEELSASSHDLSTPSNTTVNGGDNSGIAMCYASDSSSSSKSAVQNYICTSGTRQSKKLGELDMQENLVMDAVEKNHVQRADEEKPTVVPRSRYILQPLAFTISCDVIAKSSPAAQPESNHPNLKGPLPPSVCLKMKRPELIRRMENRQAAIQAAAMLRHRVAEEKKFAARAVVQGKCSLSNVKNSLSLDPTAITAFPKHEMIGMTKRHLRLSRNYRTEVSDERRRVDIAASRIIAQSFSEATRQAVLAGRSSFK